MSSSFEGNTQITGKFITFEGVEGGGKTTNIQYVSEKIQTAGYEVLLTREPGGTELSEAIRELLISKNYPEMHSNTELLLMFAARSEHLNKKILPAMESGKWVLCDRFTDATLAYQGGGRGISTEIIETLANMVQGSLKPDHTFLFDLSADIGLSRAKKRGETDRFEQQHIDFFNRVRSKYLELAELESDRYLLVNAEKELSQVQNQIDQILSDII